MTKNILKLLSLMLAVFMLLSLAACGGEGDVEIINSTVYVYESDDASSDGSDESGDGSSDVSSEEKVETDDLPDFKGREFIYVATWDPTNRNSKAGKQIQEVEKLLNCKITERKMSDYKPLYASILAGKPICDMFSPYDTTALAMANKGMLISFSDLKSFNKNASYWDKSCVKENTLNGKVYGIACTPSVRGVIMYNKTMFKKNGWEDLYELQKKDKLSWDKMFEIMKKAAQVDGGGNVTRYGLVPQYGFDGLGLKLLWANGGKIVERKGDTTNFNYTLTDSKATTALSTLNKWVSHKGAVYNATNFGWDTGRSVFASGKAAMLVADSFQFNDAIKGDNFDVGMVAFPHGPDSKQDLVMYNATPTVIPKGTANADDVIYMWDYLTRYRGTTANDYGNVEDTLPDPSCQATIDWYIDSLQSLNYVEDYGKSSKVVTEAINKAAYGELTPAAALTSIKNQVMGAMSDFWK